MSAPIQSRMKKAARPQNLKTSGAVSGNARSEKKGEAKVLPYGNNNKLPSEIIAGLISSGTAMACWEQLDQFLQADGFADRNEAEVIVNAWNETADALLDRISPDYSGLHGFALRVKYNAGGKVAEVYHVPFHTVRKLEDGTFLVNPTLGTDKYKKDKDEVLQPYNPEKWREAVDEATEEEGSQRGQLLYVYRPTTAAPIYPVPGFWTEAGRLDIESDAQISKSDHKTLKKNFRPPFMMFIPGLNTKIKDENGMTEMDYATEMVAEMVDPENEGEPIVLTAETKEAGAQLLPIDTTKQILSIDGKRDTIGRAVCRHMGVPPVLAGFSTPGQLGNNQELLNSINLLQSKANRQQRVIQRVFQKLFPGREWIISTLSPLKVIPPEIWATMTEEEKRNFGGLVPLEQPQSTEAEKTLQALNALSPLVANKVLESMTVEEIRGLIGLKGTPDASELMQTTQNNENNQG